MELSDIKKDIEGHSKSFNLFVHEDEINDRTEINDPVPIITIRDSVFAVKGDISVVGGLPKAGKTQVSAFMLATALVKERPLPFDSLEINSSFCEGKMVVYIDTEQPNSYTNKMRKQIKKILNVENQPDNLKIINLRKYDSEKKSEKVQELMKLWPDAHLWIIDGIADLIKDPNDTKESFGVIEKFMMKSNELDTAIVLYIHENPGTSGKLRGNLGSEAERKCGGAITIKKIKDKGIHSIEAKLIRGGPDFDPVFFRYDVSLGRMVSLDANESNEVKKTTDKATMKLNQRIELARRCLITGSLRSADLVHAILSCVTEIEGKSIEIRTAEGRLKQMKDMGIIKSNGDFYELADKYIPQP
jgi:hypothetical protein